MTQGPRGALPLVPGVGRAAAGVVARSQAAMRPWCSARAAPSPPRACGGTRLAGPGLRRPPLGSVFPFRSDTPSQSNAGAGLRLSAIRHNTAGVTDRKSGPKPCGTGVVTDVTDRSPDLWRPAGPRAREMVARAWLGMVDGRRSDPGGERMVAHRRLGDRIIAAALAAECVARGSVRRCRDPSR
jgi:hypothetical protein